MHNATTGFLLGTEHSNIRVLWKVSATEPRLPIISNRRYNTVVNQKVENPLFQIPQPIKSPTFSNLL